MRTHRLVTLTGPGGTGKTRLAVHLAAEVAEDFPDGVFWVPLQAVRDPANVERTIAAGVGADDGLIPHVGSKRMLLLLDNFEQIIEASTVVSSLLGQTANAKVLVTSREPLNVSSEQRYPVEPLRSEDAQRLFDERARAVVPGFRATPEVAPICEHLDRLPLAIELAAARVALLEPSDLLARLDQRLPCSPRVRATRPHGSGRCARRSSGATSCSTRASKSCSDESASSEARSRSRRRRPSAARISTVSRRS